MLLRSIICANLDHKTEFLPKIFACELPAPCARKLDANQHGPATERIRVRIRCLRDFRGRRVCVQSLACHSEICFEPGLKALTPPEEFVAEVTVRTHSAPDAVGPENNGKRLTSVPAVR